MVFSVFWNQTAHPADEREGGADFLTCGRWDCLAPDGVQGQDFVFLGQFDIPNFEFNILDIVFDAFDPVFDVVESVFDILDFEFDVFDPCVEFADIFVQVLDIFGDMA